MDPAEAPHKDDPKPRSPLWRPLISLVAGLTVVAASGLVVSAGLGTGSASAAASGLVVSPSLGTGSASAAVTGPTSILRTWQRQMAPSPTNSTLAGVSCATITTCVAVGWRSFTSHTGALAESWRGGTWEQDVVPQPPGNRDAQLQSVSCPFANPGSPPVQPTCVAVGYTGALLVARPFSEVLKGNTWKIVPVPGLAGKTVELSSVSCWSPGGCFAVGAIEHPDGGFAGAISAVFNGASWAIVAMPSAGGPGSALDGVSCLPATVPPLCKAVGQKTTGQVTSPLLELANSTRGWTVAPVPGVASSTDTALTSVACTAPDGCVAVGSKGSSSRSRAFSVVDNSGRWAIATTPTLAGAGNSGFTGVACTQFLDDCQAVGTVGTASFVPLIEQFDGAAWSVERTSAPSSLADLAGVACAFPASSHGDQVPCTAVGDYAPALDASTHVLVLHR